VRALPGAGPALTDAAEQLLAALAPHARQAFADAYLVTFGHAARGPCPMNEIEYGHLKADALFQPHRLADLAAFYRAFGLELADDAGERPDHICVELEFLCVLAAKEAYALEHQLDAEALAIIRDARRDFLREHLGQWSPAFTRRLEREAGPGPLAALARFTREFVWNQCARCGVRPGSEDLLLRPVDEAVESLCASCGITALPPGAMTAT
jgi:DMSO reductase family type II enzyme chaperone